MATKPQVSTFNGSSAGIINAILNAGIPELQGLPKVTNTTESIRQIGQQITAFEPRRNAFLNALVNRIALVTVTSKSYTNPWAALKGGMVEYGETIEEIFVSLCKPFQYDTDKAESEIYKKVIPDVQTAFHSRNYEKFYKVTVSDKELKKAFLTVDGLLTLTSSIVDTMYSSMNYDEFLVMKDMIARLTLDGKIKPVTVAAINAENITGVMVTVKEIINNMYFMNKDYNMAGVRNFSEINDLYLMKTNKFSAHADIEVLANAFNMEKADFLGNQIALDSFGKFDTDRLAEIFEGDPSFVPFTEGELTLLSTIQAVIIDKDFLKVYDNLLEFRQLENQQGLYWNNWLHVWKTFSASPFAQAAFFTTESSTITALSLTPETLSLTAGSQAQLTYSATRGGFTDISVRWSIVETHAAGTYVTQQGLLVVAADETAETLTVKITSVVDPTVTDTSVVTIL